MTATPATAAPKRVALALGEFGSAAELLHAAEKVRDAGFTRWDTHSPFPIHGMDKAMGLRDSRLGWIVLVCGFTGLLTAAGLFFYMNGWDYPLVLGGKPGDAWPAAIPVFFELTVLLSAFGAVFGMFHLNGLPRHHHPLFESERFAKASDDGFFVSIEAEDPKFDGARVRTLLEGLHAKAVELVEEEVA